MGTFRRTEVRLEREQRKALKEMAHRSGRSVSDIVREMLRQSSAGMSRIAESHLERLGERTQNGGPGGRGSCRAARIGRALGSAGASPSHRVILLDAPSFRTRRNGLMHCIAAPAETPV